MLATIFIATLLVVAVAAILRKLARDRKAGKTSCGCGCANCPSAGICHTEK